MAHPCRIQRHMQGEEVTTNPKRHFATFLITMALAGLIAAVFVLAAWTEAPNASGEAHKLANMDIKTFNSDDFHQVYDK